MPAAEVDGQSPLQRGRIEGGHGDDRRFELVQGGLQSPEVSGVAQDSEVEAPAKLRCAV